MTETEEYSISFPKTDEAEANESLAARADLILSALEAGQFSEPAVNRRALRRERFRVRGHLRLFADGEGAPLKPIFTRDVHARGLGFVTPHRLPLGYGGVIEIPNRFGRKTQIHCTLLRCRETAPGWYEGSLYFNREQHNLIPAGSTNSSSHASGPRAPSVHSIANASDDR